MKTLIATALMMVLSGCSPSQESLNQNAAGNSGERASSPLRLKESELQRVEEAATAERDQKECKSWTYDEEQVQVDLAKMRSVTLEEWGRVCYQYSCSYRGETQVEGTKKLLVVNAGGWMSLTEKGRTVYFASDKQLPGFLASCNCCE